MGLKELEPKIGGVVHYVNYRGDPGRVNQDNPAMITKIWYKQDDESGPKENICLSDIGYGVASVDLIIFSSSGFFFNKHVSQDEINKSGGTWHWPED